MSADAVRIERERDLAVVILERPPLNLFDESVVEQYERAVAELRELTAPGRPERVRAVLFEARGRVVSAGVDVHMFSDIAEGDDPVGRGTTLWTRLIALTQAVEALPVPTIFAAHGLTLTAAFELSLACDLLVGAESATFGLVEIVVGLTPSMGGPQRLAERAGPARAKDLVFTGEQFPADVLERWGVVSRVLPDDGFADAARSLAHRIAAGPTVAHAATKTIVAAAVRDGVRAADAITPQVSGPLFGTDDLRRGVSSFLAEGPGRTLDYDGR